LKAADIFVLPSREDPFALVALEAMVLGTPVIAFKDGGGIPEAIKDDHGEIVNEMNSESLADSILKLSKDKELMARYSERAKKRQKNNYDSDVLIPKIKLIIDGCLSGKYR
jgi:glycosyltransferase involved in cell wall biosynthesis